MDIRKTVCPVSRREFANSAHPLKLVLHLPNGDTVPLNLNVQQWKSGSFGWHLAKKIDVPVSGVMLRVQLHFAGYVCNSKEAEDELHVRPGHDE